MPEPLESADSAATLAEARRALEAQDGNGMASLPDAARQLQAVAPALAAIVASSGVRAQLDVHRRCGADAREQQRLLFREATTANLCLLAAGVLSALVLLGPNVRGWWAGTAGWVQHAALGIGFATLALGATAAMFSYRARESDRLRRWLGMRGAAEVARLEACRAIAAAAAKAGPATAAAAFALLVRHLLDDQRRWLAERAASHRRSSDLTNRWGGLATALAFVGGSGALVAGFVPGQGWMAIAGVVGAAVMAYSLSREGLRRDRANADRYEKSAVALDQLASRVDPIAAEIVAGRTETLPAFVDAVAGQLEAEHKQWLDGTAQAEATLAALDARLKELGEAKAPPSRGPTLVHPAEGER